ncbi:hypothetical protein MYW52_22710 [Pseudomonas juntendi]|uniref:hypothetical protein n=1 Tax=Pseudomonas juntendi TaxID=2666183 RepID=UPI001FFD5B3D|nr:hypothetical protein [Pseudomonas juntendi]MCK2118295.1 hypothetical protein [Pseudomonas juntendi]
MRHVLGIDPGLFGGIAVIDENFNLVDCFRMPVIEIDGKKKVDAGTLFKLLSKYDITLAVLEKVGTRPGEGVVGAFSFGDAYGAARAVLECLGVQYRLERPQAWRGGQGLTGLSKEQIGEIAFEVFQADEIYRGKRVKKDGTRGCKDGISDALMIAKFGVRFLE